MPMVAKFDSKSEAPRQMKNAQMSRKAAPAKAAIRS
jgi:hypothetical protein